MSAVRTAETAFAMGRGAIFTALVWARMAAGEDGTAAGSVVANLSSARPAALVAGTAGEDSLAGLTGNPARIAGLHGLSVAGTYFRLLEDSKAEQVEAALAVPFGVAGISLGLFDAGSMRLVEGDQETASVNAQRDTLLSGAFAGTLMKDVSGGVAFRWFHSVILEEYSVQTVACDAGLRWRPAGGPVTLGCVSFGNSPGVRYESGTVRMERGYTLGASMDVLSGKDWGGCAYADAQISDVPRKTEYLVGAEARLIGVLMARAGLRAADRITARSFGVGARMDIYQVDFAAVVPEGFPATTGATLTVGLK